MITNYVEFSNFPPPFDVKPLPDGMAKIMFYYDIEQLPPIGDDDDGERWSARQYTLVRQNGETLTTRIETNYDAWFALAKAEYITVAENQAREVRDALLLSTDYLMASDYPISDSDRDAIAVYRQALRDLPDTEGWPENIVWPQRPNTSAGGESFLHTVDEIKNIAVDAASLASAVRPAAQMVAAEKYSDEQLAAAASLFDEWAPDTAYKAGTILQHGGTLYRLPKDVISKAHQPPGGAGMLTVYPPVQLPAEAGKVLPWVYGETGLEIGDKREHKGAIYEAMKLPAANVHTPDIVPSVWKKL